MKGQKNNRKTGNGKMQHKTGRKKQQKTMGEMYSQIQEMQKKASQGILVMDGRGQTFLLTGRIVKVTDGKTGQEMELYPER